MPLSWEDGTGEETNPLVHLDLAVSRQGHVLDRLVTTGVLSTTEADTARTAPLALQNH